MTLDKIDFAILYHLQKDGRLSNVQLAEKIGLSESACLRRVKILTDEGVITHFTAQLDASKIGLKSSIFVRLTLDHQQDDHLERFEADIRDLPEVMECYLMSGDVDYLLRVLVRDVADYEQVHNRLTRLAGVSRVHSSFALRTVLKRTRLPLWDNHS